MLFVTPPYHGETRTIYFVMDKETEAILQTLEVGRRYQAPCGNVWRLLDLDQASGRVTVQREATDEVGTEGVYRWHLSSMLSLELMPSTP